MNNNKYFEQNVVLFVKIKRTYYWAWSNHFSVFDERPGMTSEKKPKRINLDKMPENSTNTSS